MKPPAKVTFLRRGPSFGDSIYTAQHDEGEPRHKQECDPSTLVYAVKRMLVRSRARISLQLQGGRRDRL